MIHGGCEVKVGASGERCGKETDWYASSDEVGDRAPEGRKSCAVCARHMSVLFARLTGLARPGRAR